MLVASVVSAIGPLALLACPVGMGVMMWVMARGTKSTDGPRRAAQPDPERPASIEVLREEQRRLADEIDRLEERERTPSSVEGSR